MLLSVTTGIIAFATGGQVSATPLTTSINQISTVGTIGDSVVLPSAVAGMRISIINTGANACDVFPAVDDSIGAGGDTAISLATQSGITYACYDSTNWRAV